MLLGYTVAKACASPKKFDLVHQTVSPCERVGSGDEKLLQLQYLQLYISCYEDLLTVFMYIKFQVYCQNETQTVWPAHTHLLNSPPLTFENKSQIYKECQSLHKSAVCNTIQDIDRWQRTKLSQVNKTMQFHSFSFQHLKTGVPNSKQWSAYNNYCGVPLFPPLTTPPLSQFSYCSLGMRLIMYFKPCSFQCRKGLQKQVEAVTRARAYK